MSIFRGLSFLIVVLFYASAATGQDNSSILNILNNDSIKYKIILKTPSVKEPAPGGVFRVWIKLPKESKDYFITRDSAYWIRHLADSNTDWATNLVLYYLTTENAGAFNLLYKDRKSWLPYKEGSIEKWKNWLHKWKLDK